MDKTQQIYVQDGDRATRIAFDKPPTYMWRRLLRKIELKSAGKRSNARKTIDREIRCSVLDERTGQQCNWKTTDPKDKALRVT
ncbi:hypothetical protein LIPSTDRAFT_75597 [Lipomyces starkeyi NRRL Y-11557]|uniref:Uncharacterized protein n=1 Tax=Lipomyces starkeyi NRRL Y-11557 TaxID=675824 RepID=A0A1E3PX05_LIPST|nr:hypothetical protein LIPSTDRAFT_75597 [Lipomyces starkeyi NRRL Y-11557]